MCDQTAQAGAQPSYTDTLFLPKTEFPMRPGFATRDSEFLKNLGPNNGYKALASKADFVLHDGPPYANGNLHLGHALNKVLKDLVLRTKSLEGTTTHFRPGWDCHGLPVEWKVEEAYAQQNKNKADVDVLDFRAACRDYASGWVDVQRDEFKGLAVQADWDTPYLTLDFQTEADVAAEFMEFVMNGSLYQNVKPMMWSPVEQTVLAEAEVEYYPKKSPSAWVGYKAATGPLEGSWLLAWTTTPWTLTASVGLAYSADVSYGLYKVERQTDTSWATPGDLFVLATSRVDDVEKALRVAFSFVKDVSSEDLAKTTLLHPLKDTHSYWAEPLGCWAGQHVSDEAGSGLVHTAPAHGPEDFFFGKSLNLPCVDVLEKNGEMLTTLPVFGGLQVLEHKGKVSEANDAVLTALQGASTLMGRTTYTHSYPHSWRSKAPVLYKTTPQWFVSMDTPLNDDLAHTGSTLRERALNALETVTFVPKTGYTRLKDMVSKRPDWVLSRQRQWGVPLTLFVRKDKTSKEEGYLLQDPKVNARVYESFKAHGADAWYAPNAKETYLGQDYNPDDYEQCFDVLDVWFESGCSHVFALKNQGPADMYLEGTDQHRGWFQSSLLHSAARFGKAPYKTVVTHGFALDGKGKKMSKSEGNTVTPQDVLKENGVDGLRLWVALSDYTHDFRASKESFNGAKDMYKKLRNTLKFMLGVLNDDMLTQDMRNFTHPQGTKGPNPATLSLLESWLLDALNTVNLQVRQAFEELDFARGYKLAHDFCAHTLSSVYCETRKDALYCDPETSMARQASLKTLSLCLDVCLSWVAPALPLLTQEATLLRYNDTVNVRFLDLDAYANATAQKEMELYLTLKSVTNQALQNMPKEEKPKPGMAVLNVTANTDFSQPFLSVFLGAGKVTVVKGDTLTPTVEVKGQTPHSCPRCWTGRQEEGLCQRCEDTLNTQAS